MKKQVLAIAIGLSLLAPFTLSAQAADTTTTPAPTFKMMTKKHVVKPIVKTDKGDGKMMKADKMKKVDYSTYSGAMTTKGKTNVRPTAGMGKTILATLDKGASVNVTKVEGNWCAIDHAWKDKKGVDQTSAYVFCGLLVPPTK